MQDIVAIRVVDKKRGKAAFLTWGRVFDSTDTTALRDVVAKVAAARFGFRHIVSVEVCECLQEVGRYKYFFEALAAFSGKRIPFGRKTYGPWAAKMRKAIKSGKELYLLGDV